MQKQARSIFRALGWTINEAPRRPGLRYDILHAASGGSAIAIAITDDQVNAYNVGLMGNAMSKVDYGALQIVVGKSVAPDATEAAKARRMAIGQHGEASKLIEIAVRQLG